MEEQKDSLLLKDSFELLTETDKSYEDYLLSLRGDKVVGHSFKALGCPLAHFVAFSLGLDDCALTDGVAVMYRGEDRRSVTRVAATDWMQRTMQEHDSRGCGINRPITARQALDDLRRVRAMVESEIEDDGTEELQAAMIDNHSVPLFNGE